MLIVRYRKRKKKMPILDMKTNIHQLTKELSEIREIIKEFRPMLREWELNKKLEKRRKELEEYDL